MRKAVFFDIDGTLWDEKSYIPPSTREAIQKLRQNGHLAFICTGRTKGFVRDENLLSIGFDGIVAGCGTYIEYDKSVVLYKKLDNLKVVDHLRRLRTYGYKMILEGNKNLYMNVEDFSGNPFAIKLRKELGDDVLSIDGNETMWEISKFSAEAPNEEALAALEEFKDEYDVLVHGIHAIEFVPKGFSKATGIQRTCEFLHIDQKDTYAFGDSVNDLEMLKYVAHGIAMGNGMDVAKAAAEYTTSTLHEDGIYKGLEYYNLL